MRWPRRLVIKIELFLKCFIQFKILFKTKLLEQKVVYRFLKDIKDEEYDNERNTNSALSQPESNVSDKAQSLEDILENLKK